jgi:hypothetical protein
LHDRLPAESKKAPVQVFGKEMDILFFNLVAQITVLYRHAPGDAL